MNRKLDISPATSRGFYVYKSIWQTSVSDASVRQLSHLWRVVAHAHLISIEVTRIWRGDRITIILHLTGKLRLIYKLLRILSLGNKISKVWSLTHEWIWRPFSSRIFGNGVWFVSTQIFMDTLLLSKIWMDNLLECEMLSFFYENELDYFVFFSMAHLSFWQPKHGTIFPRHWQQHIGRSPTSCAAG